MREAPVVEQFAQQNSGKAKVVSIGFGSDAAASRSFGQNAGMSTPIALTDQGLGVGRHYGVLNFPSWFLLDSSGNLVSQGSRFDSGPQAALDKLG